MVLQKARAVAVVGGAALAALLALPPIVSPADAELPTVEERTFRSDGLGQDRSYSVLLPVGYGASTRRYPVLYLLHGKSGDHTDWSRRAPLRQAVGSAPLIVVMPDGDDGWYIDWAEGRRGYEAQIVRDLIPHVDAAYRTLARREGRALAGLSMGGYGALKLALRHPHLFASAASQSGAVRMTRELWDEDLHISAPAPRPAAGASRTT